MLNDFTLQGRFVEDPTFGDTKGGTRFANFRLAWNKKIGEKESKLYIECKAFGGTAQFMEKYMNHKGQEILAEGELNTEEWTSQEGQKRSKIVMVVRGVHFCGKRQDGGAAPAEAPAQEGGFTAVETDEMPF